MGRAHCVVDLQDRVARVVCLALRRHDRDAVIGRRLQALCLVCVAWVGSTLVEVLVVEVVGHVRLLLPIRLHRYDRVESRDIASLRYVFVPSELLL